MHSDLNFWITKGLAQVGSSSINQIPYKKKKKKKIMKDFNFRKVLSLKIDEFFDTPKIWQFLKPEPPPNSETSASMITVLMIFSIDSDSMLNKFVFD